MLATSASQIVRIIEATAASPAWRDRVQLAKGFAEDIARMLVEDIAT